MSSSSSGSGSGSSSIHIRLVEEQDRDAVRSLLRQFYISLWWPSCKAYLQRNAVNTAAYAAASLILTVQAWSELEDFVHSCDDLRDIMAVYRRHPRQRMWVAVERTGSPPEPSAAGAATRVRERVLGCVGLQDMGGGAAELVRMVLVPEARGHRLGGRLLQAWREHALEQGFTSMQLRTNFLLQRAVRFYANEGLVLASRQPRTLMRGDLLYFHMPLSRNADDKSE